MTRIFYFVVFSFLFANINMEGQTAWYNSAQSRIDTLRKENFIVRIVDNLGNDHVIDRRYHGGLDKACYKSRVFRVY